VKAGRAQWCKCCELWLGKPEKFVSECSE